MSIFALACRRVIARPLRSTLLFLAVFSVTLLLGSGLLVLAAVEVTADRIVEVGPSIVVSRVDAGGWAPIPIEVVSSVLKVRGVTGARARVWGILPGVPRITLVGDPALPEPVELMLGGIVTAIPGAREGDPLELTGLDGRSVALTIVRVLPPETATVARDVVFVPEGVARQLLLLPAGHATDVAVATIRPEEDAAVTREIARSLGFPVRALTREQMRGAFRTQLGDRGGLWLLFALPAVLGLVLVVGQIASGGPNARVEAGRLKLLGWTTWDVARIHLYEALVPSGLAVTTALIVSYVGVFFAGGGPAAAALLGFERLSPAFTLATSAAPLALAEVAASVLLPTLLAALVPAARVATADPAELLEAT